MKQDQVFANGVDRRAFLQAGAAAALAGASGSALAQSVPTLEILVANALVGGPLKGILEAEAKCKINDAPFQSSTDVVARLVAHRGFSEDDARARIARQASRDDRLKGADFVVDNSGDRQSLAGQIERLWSWLTSLPQLPADFEPPRPKKTT
ncbi:MAG: dephospho-CoA kinase [Acidimicrobiia bacterium]|nr:dephospho-CoA kinase [Acidimicrobiia bacterium]